MKRRAVWRMVAASGSLGPAISVRNSAWRPPMRSRGSTAKKTTMIPTPPSQAVNCRHISTERGSAGTSVATVAPAVEKPDMDSNRASTGLASCSVARMYGSAPDTATSSHSSEMTR